MYIYLSIYLSTYLPIYLSIHTYIHTHIHTFIHRRTGGVMGAGVEHEDGAGGRRLDVLEHPGEVEPDRLLVVVPAACPCVCARVH